MGEGWIGKLKDRTDAALGWLDSLPLWWVIFPLLLVVLGPNIVLGEKSVFIIHDQLDEEILCFVLTARHPGENVIPEMLGGIGSGGLQPSAVLFLVLYCLLPPFYAFLCSYGLLLLCGFLGMYLTVKELTESSILAVTAGGIFCMLSLYPVYGLSLMGIPLVVYAYLCLRRRKKRVCALLLTLFFGLTSHLVFVGYAVLAFWAAALAYEFFREKRGKALFFWEGGGFLLLLGTYLLTNMELLGETLLGAGVSHREEMINGAVPFWEAVKGLFLDSGLHATSHHRALILPILALLVVEGLLYRRLNEKARKCFRQAAAGFGILAGIALFYGVCKSGPVTAWKNSMHGFLRSFQMDRFYWLYPTGWYLELALTFGVWWNQSRQRGADAETGEKQDREKGRPGKRGLSLLKEGLSVPTLVLVVAVLPTVSTVIKNSCFYMNVNQYNNGSQVTGYITWESWYSEELMGKLEEVIGRDMDTYRVAHLGVNPTPALMHGFYTVDGYSGNYPLDYKHTFRKVIADELARAEETAVYFDKWGSRCYLFNSITGNYWMLSKDSEVQYAGLAFDMEALADLGCEYLFSGGEILDAERMGLEFMGYYETEESYWGIWLYRLKGSEEPARADSFG